MKVIKYIGTFSGAQANGIEFPKGTPVVVETDSLANALLEQPDFAPASFEAEAAPSPTAPTAGKVVVTAAPQEKE